MSSRKVDNNLRVGCICDGPEVPYWQWRCLKELGEQKNVEITGVYIPAEELAGPKKSPVGRLLDFYISHLNRPPDFRPEDIRDYLSEDKIHSLECRRAGERFDLPPEQEKVIKEASLDVLLLFSRLPFASEIDSLAARGAWLPSPVEQAHYNGVPPGFWELYSGKPATPVWLRRLGENKILRTAHFKTRSGSYSGQLNKLVHEALSLPVQAGRMAAGDPPAGLPEKPECKITPPGLHNLAIFLVLILINWFKIRWKILFKHNRWNIGVLKLSPASLLEKGSVSPDWFPPAGPADFRADPFGIVKDRGRIEVFYEKLENDRGHLASCGYKDGWLPEEKEVLRGKPHFSYPYLLAHENEYFCLPEQADKNRISLYRLDDNTGELTDERVLIEDIPALDPTPLKYNDSWWLFFTDAVKGPSNWLQLWRAPDLFGSWRPHPGNPVKMDVRSARPAGTPFRHGGALYRPAQDCSQAYGKRVVINKILKLAEEEFREEPVCLLEADQTGRFSRGLHTVSFAGDYLLVDGKRQVFTWPNFKQGCRKLFSGGGS